MQRGYNGAPFLLDPRNVLRSALQPLLNLGLRPVMATELEFYLIAQEGDSFKPRLAGIHYGLKNQCEPGTMIPEKADIEYSTTLPVRWSHALNAFEAGNVLPAYFVNEYHHVFSICRRDEESRFHSEVSNLDYQWYLRSI